MSRPVDDRRVVVVLNGPNERLVLDTAALLSQDNPRLVGSGFDRAAGKLAARIPPAATRTVLSGFVALLSEMGMAGRLPQIRQGRARPASRDELLLVALLSAAQRDDRGRAIEAAIALLDTGYVHQVVAAAKMLGTRLAERGVVLARIGAPTFDHVAGYPAVEDPLGAVSAPVAPATGSTRPTLRLLESA